jgi:hypothetical protein
VYCPDLAFLIRHIHRRVSGDVASMGRSAGGTAETAREAT